MVTQAAHSHTDNARRATFQQGYIARRCRHNASMRTFIFITRLCALSICMGASWAQTQPDPAQLQARATSPEVRAQVQALITQTRQNLRPFAAGSFWLGDWGIFMPSDGYGKFDLHPPKGPKMPELKGLPFTYDDDNKPPRWVSLSGFYMGAYKVTYADFDVYVAANALPAHPPTVTI